jgi:hypothetical protein
MPDWQAWTMVQLADGIEKIDGVWQPIDLGLQKLYQRLRDSLTGTVKAMAIKLGQVMEESGIDIFSLMLFLIFLLLCILWQKARFTLWIWSRLDYIRFGLLARHAPGNLGVYQYYSAVQRLLAFYGLPRQSTANAREYLGEICQIYRLASDDATRLTELFEVARYGDGEMTAEDVERMRHAYRGLYVRTQS